MQGPKNMFEMLVSRFLYVLCWRNKVVIILIILSASVGMLMMLSYHGNKHPGSVDEVLRSGKSRISPNTDNAQTDQSIVRLSQTKLGIAHTDEMKLGPGNRKYWHRDQDENHDTEKKQPVVPIEISNADLIDKGNGKRKPVEPWRKRKSELVSDGSRKKLKQDVTVFGPVHNKTQKNARGGSLLQKPNEKPVFVLDERPSDKQAKGQEEIDINNNLFGEEIKLERAKIPSTGRNDKFRKPDMNKPLIVDLKIVNKHMGNRSQSSPKGPSDIRLTLENVMKMDRVNDTGYIDRRKEQEGKLARLRKKNKIDALLKVLNKHSTVQIPTVQSRPNQKEGKNNLLLERADGSNQGSTGQVKSSAKTLSPENTGDKNLAWKPKADNQLVWHRDHYHRDENSAVIQEKVVKNGALQFILKQSSEKPNDMTLGDRRQQDLKVGDVTQLKEPGERSENLSLNRTGKNNMIHSVSDTAKMHSPSNISNLFALAHQHALKKFKPKHVSVSFRSNGFWPDRMTEWLESEEKFCDGRIIAYNNEFAFVKNAIMDRNFCHGRKGGELITDVINQPEEEEYYTYFPGFFQLPCSVQPQYFFNNNNHLNQWLYSVSNTPDSQLYSEKHSEFTVLVVRYEYANLYHTMTDWYNAFLLMEFFNKTQTDTNILIVDGHPAGALDGVWNVLFNSSKRISAQSMRTKYSQLVWNTLGYNSLMMDHYAPNIPIIEEFRTFFLSSFRITETRKLDCDRINILFIWRRDYVAHPRNPSGSISRKIQNEQELVITLRQNFPTFTVKGIQIDLFEMDQQLKFVTETDLLIGMHGAGLTHAMFLPKHAGMIELLPTYWSAANEHFHAIARWRHIHYRQWTNTDPENEAPNHYTKIPPEVLNSLVVDMVKVVCGLATDPPESF